MGRLSTQAGAKAGAVVRALVRAISILTLVLTIFSAVLSPLTVSQGHTPSLDLLTLELIKTAGTVRIQIGASRSLAGAVIEQSAGPREVSIRIMGASSHLEPNYSGTDRLVRSVRIVSGGQRDGNWVDIVIDIDEGTAVTFQKASNALLIEASRTGYFSPTRTIESRSRPRAVAADSVAVTQPKADTSSSNETANEPAPINRQEVNSAQQPKQGPSSSNGADVHLLELNIRKISGTPSIQVLADRPVTDLVIEQSAGAAETLLRIRGVHSSLEPKYSSADPLITSVRTVSGGEAGSPWVDIIIETAPGAAISTRKNSNYLNIEVSQIAYFRQTPAGEKKPGPKTKSAPAATKATSAKSADTVTPSVVETKKAETKTGSQIEATSKSPTTAVAVKTSAADSPSQAEVSVTVAAPIKTQEALTTTAQSGGPKRPGTDSGGESKAAVQVSTAATLVTVPAPINTPPTSIVPAGEARKPATSPADLATARVEAPVITTSQRLSASAAQQGSEGQLHGVVVDEAGALIVDATVVLDDGHGHKYTARTNDSGRYEISNLLAGAYVLTVTSEGFDAFKQDLEIAPQKIAALDVTLKILVSVQVEVRPGPASDLSGTILTGKDIEALPSDPARLIRKLQEMAAMMGIPNARIIVDGSADRLPAKEDIQMIKISPHSFAAEYSQPTEGQIEVTTRPSGHFHGDFSFNFNDEALNARNAFASSRAPLQIREYNGYLSGPIIPHRWSFSAYVGRYEQDENSLVNAVILNRALLLPQSFSTTIQTPNREDYLSLGTTYLLRQKHTLRLKYSSSKSSYLNQGVGGFDLPERAYNSSAHSETVKFGATSTFSERTINELRLQFSRSSSEARASTFAPAVFVLDSFNAGGNQESLLNDYSIRNMEIGDSLTYNHKKHLMKFGFGGYGASTSNLERSNFGGTFTFGSDVERDASGNPILVDGQPITISALERYRRTLLGLPGYGPSQFSIVRGNPSVGLKQWEMAWFAQDDWALSPRLTFSYGLRHDFQTNLGDKLNLAPRLGLALRPFKKRQDVVRAGTGIFYSSVGSDITLDTIKLDGQHQQQLDVQDPQFFPTVPDNLSAATTTLPTVRRKDPNLHAPFYFISSVIYQPQLRWGLNGSISYTQQRGYRALRERNINAPVSLTGLRPFPTQGPILQFESTGKFTRRALGFSLGKSISSKISIHGSYTLAYAHSDTDGAYYAPANSYDLSTEFSRAASDPRHQFKLQGWMSLPWNFDLSPYFYVSSGSPFNITTGQDNNGDTLFVDRPAFAQAGDPGAIVTPFGIFQPNPGLGVQIIPRNFGQGPGTVSAGLNLSKTISFHLPISKTSEGEGFGSILSRGRNSARGPYSLTFNMDVQNLLNHTNLGGFNGVLTSPFFGKANRADSPRKIRLSLDLSF